MDFTTIALLIFMVGVLVTLIDAKVAQVIQYIGAALFVLAVAVSYLR